MRHAASRIAVQLTAAVSLGAIVCCQQILGLDEGKLGAGGGGGGQATVSGLSGMGGVSPSGSTAVSGTSSGGGSSSTSTSTSTSASTSTSTSASTSTSTSASTSTSTSSSGGCVGGVTITMANLIDDMEQGVGSIIKQGGRDGSWFTYNDMTPGGVQTPAAGGPCLPSLIPGGGRCGSLHAMHTFGSGFTGYGMGIGFDLNNPSGTRMPYDVSAYTGIAFWGLGPEVVEVQIVEEETAPVSQGGTCATSCGDHFFLAVDLTGSWQEVVVPFSMLKQQGWGTAAAWDPKKVLAVQFAVNPAPMFDFWIDDVGLY